MLSTSFRSSWTFLDSPCFPLASPVPVFVYLIIIYFFSAFTILRNWCTFRTFHPDPKIFLTFQQILIFFYFFKNLLSSILALLPIVRWLTRQLILVLQPYIFYLIANHFTILFHDLKNIIYKFTFALR